MLHQLTSSHLQLSFAGNDARKCKSALIVVASLVDKAPNLGGLARTCEIFQAQHLVVSDMNIVDHRDFTLLSMGAEKWASIKAVPPDRLAAWLLVCVIASSADAVQHQDGTVCSDDLICCSGVLITTFWSTYQPRAFRCECAVMMQMMHGERRATSVRIVLQ
jgi:hypothetical protein